MKIRADKSRGSGPLFGFLQLKCACSRSHDASGECAECHKKKLQRYGAGQTEPSAVPPIVHDVLRSPGEPLDPVMRSFMESRFSQNLRRVPSGPQAKLTIGPPGDEYEQEADSVADQVGCGHRLPSNTRHDFNDVRLHTDTKAAESARAVNALAYTVGSDIVFASGYSPSTASGQRLLAHELTHVIQQSAGDEPRVQRQIKFPVFDEADICVIDPVFNKKVCGSYAKTFCEKAPFMPGCGFVCEKLGCKRTAKPSVSCPPGFRPATSTAFKGQCCIEGRTIESERDCCPPARAASTLLGPRCCAPVEVASKGECVRASGQPEPGPTPGPISPCLPGEVPNLFGGCCAPGAKVDKQGRPCPSLPVPGPKPKPTATPPPANLVLRFNQDQPMAGSELTEDALLWSLTAESKSAWHELAKQLQINPEWKFQLTGKASPEGSPSHNLDLAQRRAQLAEKVLVDKGIERGRIIDVAPECTKVETGVYSCGAVGATGPRDRQVKIEFAVSAGAAPQ